MSKGTPARAIRISDAEWQRVKDAADAYGITPSDVVRRLINEHIDDFYFDGEAVDD